MGKILTAVALAALAVGTATASDKTDVLAVINQWVDGFNSGHDLKPLAMSTCADQATILDSIPPYDTRGEGACAKWLANFNAFTKTSEMTDMSARLGKIRHLEITGDRAYVVAPVAFAYKLKAKPTKETGEWTVALQKGASGWRINAWTYTLGKVEPVTEAGPGK